MRINKFIALHTYISRRQADDAIRAARITINGRTAQIGDTVDDGDVVTLDNSPIHPNTIEQSTLLLNKPVGYVCSRDGQGSPTVYDLIPEKYHHMNIAGRLDKDSSGLVILTSDGNLLYELTHPSNNKEKVYEVVLNRELSESELNTLRKGIDIDDARPSMFKAIEKISPKTYKIFLEEGRNRQIRRTMDAVRARVKSLQRTQLADYTLDTLDGKTYKTM